MVIKRFGMSHIILCTMLAMVLIPAFSRDVVADVMVGPVIMSDDFNEPDRTYVGLTTTNQGVDWYQAGGPPYFDEYAPGIHNQAMMWSETTATAQPVSVEDLVVQDFQAEFDYVRETSYDATQYSVFFNFRMAYKNTRVTDGGVSRGYAIFIRNTSATEVGVGILTDYEVAGPNNTVVNVIDQIVDTGGLGAHIKVLAVGANVKVYVTDVNDDELMVIDWTDDTENPGQNTSGHIVYQGGSSIWHGFDNIVISEVFETTGDGNLLFYDTFSRADSTDLGVDEFAGLQWQKRVLAVGDANPTISGGTMEWLDHYGETTNLYLRDTAPAQAKNFTMDYDIDCDTYYSYVYFRTAFRMQYGGGFTSDGGVQPGYNINIDFTNSSTGRVKLYSEYPSGSPATVIAEGSAAVSSDRACHVTLQAEDNNIKVWLDGNLAIDFTDISGNPAANEDISDGLIYGAFSFQSHAYIGTKLDNLFVYSSDEVPDTGEEFIIFSDDFSSPDSDKDLGTTDQGSVWTRRVLDDVGDVNDPGISDGRLIWDLSGTSYIPDGIYPSDVEAVKNFSLEFDYLRITPSYADAKAVIIDSRISSRFSLISDAGDTTGVRVLIKQPTATTVNVGIYAEPGTQQLDTAINTGGLGGHIKILAVDNVYKVYVTDINGVEQLANSYVVPSANAASEKAGFFVFSASSARDHGIDSVVCTRLPEYCGDIATVYKDGDVNKDCYVDLADFAALAFDWMECVDPENSLCTNWWD